MALIARAGCVVDAPQCGGLVPGIRRERHHLDWLGNERRNSLLDTFEIGIDYFRIYRLYKNLMLLKELE